MKSHEMTNGRRAGASRFRNYSFLPQFNQNLAVASISHVELWIME